MNIMPIQVTRQGDTPRPEDWHGRILPAFRLDALVNLGTENWRDHITTLAEPKDWKLISSNPLIIRRYPL